MIPELCSRSAKMQQVQCRLARVMMLLLLACTGCQSPLRNSQPVFSPYPANSQASASQSVDRNRLASQRNPQTATPPATTPAPSQRSVAAALPDSSANQHPVAHAKDATVLRGQGPTEYFHNPLRRATTSTPVPTIAGQSPITSPTVGSGYPAATGYPSAPGYAQASVYPGATSGAPRTQPTAAESLWGMPPAQGVPATASPYQSNIPMTSQGAGAPASYPTSSYPTSSYPTSSNPASSESLWGNPPVGVPTLNGSPANSALPYPPPSAGMGAGVGAATWGNPTGPPPQANGIMNLPSNLADILVNVHEAQTGRFMVGAAVNSDAGVTGRIMLEERNFAFPRTWAELCGENGYRGRGQGLRIEAMPGSQVQRYKIQFTDPYAFNTRISMEVSGYLYDRQFFDWSEQRLGGSVGLGYRLGPDMAIAASLRGEEVKIWNPRVAGVDLLDDAVGRSELYSARVNLTQDTRDIPFQPTQGYYFEFAYQQYFGTYDFPRFDLDFRRYFLLAERPDGSGRHTLGFSNSLGISGKQTPIFENYFAGGYATLRGFDFRRASPQSMGVTTGGRLQLLGSAEYMFPITADDMIKGVAFVDYGTVEERIKIESDDFRVALGLGLRVNIPAMGPAPIALDFAVPVAREETDEIRNFSIFMGVSR